MKCVKILSLLHSHVILMNKILGFADLVNPLFLPLLYGVWYNDYIF